MFTIFLQAMVRDSIERGNAKCSGENSVNLEQNNLIFHSKPSLQPSGLLNNYTSKAKPVAPILSRLQDVNNIHCPAGSWQPWAADQHNSEKPEAEAWGCLVVKSECFCEELCRCHRPRDKHPHRSCKRVAHHRKHWKTRCTIPSKYFLLVFLSESGDRKLASFTRWRPWK